MTAVDDLIAWLRAQLDEDERVARAAAILPYGCAEWFSGAEGCVFGKDPASELHVRGAVLSLDDIGAHIARWDPARVLAEVEAKRRILDLHAESDFPYDPDSAGPGNYSWTPQCQGCYEDAPCLTVRLLAQPYAGRDGWREEWAA